MGISPLIANVARSALTFNAIALNPILKIHPSVGIARLGDALTAFFIGPERPLAGNTGADGEAPGSSAAPPFRDGGKVKRQAARFRIFNYPLVGDPEEINLDHPDVADIEWAVHLANRKAAFFLFDGQRGATGPFLGAVQDRRNKSIPAADRDAKLVIDPGPRSINGPSSGPIKFDSSSGSFPKDVGGAPVIDFLGELRTDSKGRLLVLGGRGKSASSNALPADANQRAALRFQGLPETGPGRPAAPILEYANNDSWFDDISDGPVTARVLLKTGRTLTVQFPAWVLVGPPDFAPEIRNVVSLYDTMLDVAVRELPDPAAPFYTALDLADLKMLKASFRGTASVLIDFVLNVDPIITAGFNARFVHEPVHSKHSTLGISNLNDPSPAAASTRDIVFRRLRPPAGNTVYSEGQIHSMPKLFGDKYFDAGDPKRVLAVTRVQHHILKLWKDGKFRVSVTGPSPNFTPQGLDRASLESCVGGAFFPGIECSWLVREKGIYSEPFRIKPGARVGSLTVGPGFFSQQMALPWQADFLDCAKDDQSLGFFFGWWPAQRPDDVYTSAADAAAETGMVSWARGIPPLVPAPGPPATLPLRRAVAYNVSHANMVANALKLGFVISATVAGQKVFFEDPSGRTLP